MPEAAESRPVSIDATSGAPVIDVKNSLPPDDEAAKAADQVVEDDSPEEAEKKAQARRDAAMKGELTKERNRRREASQQLQATQAKLDQAIAALEAATKAPEPDRPKRADYSDPDDYDAALEKYAADRAEKATETKLRQKIAQETAERQSRELTDNFREAIEKFTEDHPDFEDVFTEDLPITIAMSHAIMSSDSPAEIAYYLGQNPDEAKRISQLTDVRAVKELGRIEERLAAPPPRERSASKPAPIRPVGTRSGATAKDITQMTMAEYAEHRQAQLRGNGLAH